MFAIYDWRMSLPKPSEGFHWVQAAAGPALVCGALEPCAAHLFTTRRWLLGTADAGDRAAGWSDVAGVLDLEAAHLSRLHQVHGASVVVLRRGGSTAPPDHPLPDADIIVSNDPSRALAIQTADCVPLLIADRRGGAVAAAHAGWRGLAARVPGVAVRALADAFGSRPDDLIVAIGPSISAPKYEVDAPVRAAFEAAGHSPALLARWFIASERAAHWYFDGWASALDQLAAAGVPPAQLFTSGLCTASHPDILCSYRRDGKTAGRTAAAIRARGE
jgi:YfiH family protein